MELDFSVITPVYNSRKFIKKSLDSVCKQKFNKFELILIDDGSTDNSKAILNIYKKKYKFIKIIKNKNNLGVSISRNKALRASKGNYIIFLDSDDYLLKNSLIKLKKEIDKNSYDYFFVKSRDLRNGKVDHNQIFDKKKKYFLPEYIKSNFHFRSTSWNFVIKKSYLKKEKIKFENIRIYEDQIFTSKVMLLTNNFGIMSKPIYARTTSDPNSLGKAVGFDLGISCLKSIYGLINFIDNKKKSINQKNLNFLISRINYVLQDFNLNLISSNRNEIIKYANYINSKINKFIKIKNYNFKNKLFLFQNRDYFKKGKKNIFNCLNKYQIKEEKKIINKIKVSKNKKSFLYCANQASKIILKLCKKNKIPINGIIDNNKHFLNKKIDGKKIYSDKFLKKKIKKSNKNLNILICNLEKDLINKITKTISKNKKTYISNFLV